MFSEIEQEEIINKFLGDININETKKIIQKEIAKHNPIELVNLNLPSECLNLIQDYSIKCDCRKCDYLNRVMFVHTDKRYSACVKTNHFFTEFYKFPLEDKLKPHFKLSKKKYNLLQLIYQFKFDIGSLNIKYFIGEHYKDVDKVVKEFNEIIKFIYENDFTIIENIKLNYYPEIKWW